LFSIFPLYDSSDHEDVSVSDLEIYDHGCCDIFTHSSNHDSLFFAVEFSKPPMFDDLSSDDLELLQVVEEL